MKTLLALVGLVAVAVILFLALNHDRFFPKQRTPRLELVTTPPRSLLPPPDRQSPLPTAPFGMPAAITDTNPAPATATDAPSASAAIAPSWESQAAERYSAIIDKIRKERTK